MTSFNNRLTAQAKPKLTGQALLDYCHENHEQSRIELCEGAGYERKFADLYEAILEARKANGEYQQPVQSGADWYDSLSDQERDLYDKLEDLCPEMENLDAEQCQELMDELSELGITTADQFEDRYAWHDVCSEELAEQFFAKYHAEMFLGKGSAGISMKEWQRIWDEELSSKFQCIYFDDVAYFFSKGESNEAPNN